jgi:hypothetical protein
MVESNLYLSLHFKLYNNMVFGDISKCTYCNIDIIYNVKLKNPNRRTKDHIVPKAKGGKGLQHNTCWCCTTCNNIKGDFTLEEFSVLLREKYISTTNRFKADYYNTIISNISKVIKYRDKYNPKERKILNQIVLDHNKSIQDRLDKLERREKVSICIYI